MKEQLDAFAVTIGESNLVSALLKHKGNFVAKFQDKMNEAVIALDKKKSKRTEKEKELIKIYKSVNKELKNFRKEKAKDISSNLKELCEEKDNSIVLFLIFEANIPMLLGKLCYSTSEEEKNKFKYVLCMKPKNKTLSQIYGRFGEKCNGVKFNSDSNIIEINRVLTDRSNVRIGTMSNYEIIPKTDPELPIIKSELTIAKSCDHCNGLDNAESCESECDEKFNEMVINRQREANEWYNCQTGAIESYLDGKEFKFLVLQTVVFLQKLSLRSNLKSSLAMQSLNPKSPFINVLIYGTKLR